MGFPGGLSGEKLACQSKRPSFNPRVENPWRRAPQPAPAFLPGEPRGQRSLVGSSPWGRQGSGRTEVTAHRCMFQVNREKQQGRPAPRPRNLSPLPHPLSSLFLYFLGSFRERIHVLYCFTSSLFFSPKHSFWKTTRLSWLTAIEIHPHPTRGRVVCVPSLQPCPVLQDPLDYSPPGIPSSVHGILQTGILEWVSMPSSRRSPQARD